jgi:allantoinase
MKARPSLVLRCQRTVIDGEVRPAAVVVTDGRVSAILDFDAAVDAPADEIIERGVLIPGLVDTHVHINEPGRTEWEGFNTATQAAAAGGITTVVDMPLNCTPVTTTADALRQKMDSLQGKLWVDCGFWGGVVPDSVDQLEALVDAGVLGVKSFTIHSGIDDFPMVEEQHLRRAMRILAPTGIPYLIHAELDQDHSEPPEIGRSYQSFLASRPRRWEDDAIDMLIQLAREAAKEGVQARLHIVHLSSADALPALAQAQDQGLGISAETCPHYLTLFAEDIPDGKTLFKCCPPIREDENRQRLWRGLEEGTIEFVVSDHSPCTPQLKHIDSGDIEHAWGGISSLQFGLSLIWTEARQRGYRIEQIVEWMATRPAVFAGLGERKGRIAVGYDADFCVFDDAADYVISADMIKYRHRVTPYEGRLVTGVIDKTFVRGREVFAAGEILGSPVGGPLLRGDSAGP